MRCLILLAIILPVFMGACTDDGAVRQQASTGGAAGVPPEMEQGAPESLPAALQLLLTKPQQSLADKGPLAQLAAFYQRRAYSPLWIQSGKLNRNGQDLARRLDRTYSASRLEVPALIHGALSGQVGSNTADQAALELTLSTSMAQMAIDRRNPRVGTSWPEVLEQVALTQDVARVLDDVLPADPALWRLRTAIAAYQSIKAQGGWPILPDGAKLSLGTRDARIAILRARLLASGDLPAPTSMDDILDYAMSEAVKRFQRRHGLQPDGVVGTDTRDALNQSVDARLHMLALNLARLLGERREWGGRYIAVNVAAAAYKLVENGQTVFERPAIVGRPDWPTPRLEGVIDTLQFHPPWVVPPRIARLEIWPKVRRDPNYLASQDMRVVDGQISQAPGPRNPLGIVKFIFPNDQSIYLHDTNHPELFAQVARFRSHGCIRVSQALGLARHLLKEDPAWPEWRVEEIIQGGRTVRVDLTDPIPVHIVYDTAWVDDDGIVQFRRDAYRRDHLAAIQVASATGWPNCR